MDINKILQDKAYKLFEENKITCFIGYEQGSLSYKTRPCFITRKEEVNRLVFNSFCINNLSIYLEQYKDKKIGILATPCTLRSIIALKQGNQVILENIYILGVNCPGMIDPEKINDLHFWEIKSIEENNDKVIINTGEGKHEIIKSSVFYDKCQNCNHKLPCFYNELLGEEQVNKESCIDEYASVRELEKLPIDERWEYWEKEFQKCIRCYACRNVCPVCYCKECVVDKTIPQWISKINQSSINEYYNLMRVLHVMG
ncbi:MAG: 4Fe-4S ferredoxin, partial [Candidatus Firestonebacteria bacterium]|nr:4Fe-4S ferredoxin [Candidatus Firestonebacteria bacterium]